MSEPECEWLIRDGKDADEAFIYSSWSNSYRYGSAMGKSCKNKIFYPNFAKVINSILSKPNTQVIVAVNKEDPLVIFGYVITQPGIIHYVFVKEAFRSFGIGRALYDACGEIDFYTFKTFSLTPILREYGKELINYNPFLIFQQKEGAPSGKTV